MNLTKTEREDIVGSLFFLLLLAAALFLSSFL